MKKILFIFCLAAFAFTGCVEEPCDNVICANGGQDVVQGEECVCECLPGFSGTLCEKDDLCATVNCENNGECNADGKCDCPPNYGGDNCEIILCNAASCEENGGTCVDGTCNCPAGFSGVNCEVDDACEEVNCLNGAEDCNLGICACPDGFIGDDCSVKIDIWEASDMCAVYYNGNPFTYTARIEQNTITGLTQITNFGNVSPSGELGSYFTFEIDIMDNVITLLNSTGIDILGNEYKIENTIGMVSSDGNTINWTYDITTTYSNGEMLTEACSGNWTKYQ